MPRKDKRKAVIAPAPVPDDFKRIEGIGLVIEKRLHDAGIQTYAELAKLTPEQVADRTGSLSAKIIARKHWIKQAARLASESAGRPLHRVRFRIDLMLDVNNRVKYTRVKHIKHEEDEAELNKWDDSWGKWSEERLINFFVQRAGIEPQSIRVPLPAVKTESTIKKQGVQTRESEAMLERPIDQLPSENQLRAEASTSAPSAVMAVEPGVPLTQPVGRALKSTVEREPAQDQVPIQLPAEAAATTEHKFAKDQVPIQPAAETTAQQVPSAAVPVEPSPTLQIVASDMQVLESPIQSQIGGFPFSKRLRARFSCQLSGAEASRLATERLPYFIQILACELSTGQMTVLATDKQTLDPGTMIYKPTADFAIPAVGRYQTFGVIFISIQDDNSIPDRARVDVAWGPIINIIP